MYPNSDYPLATTKRNLDSKYFKLKSCLNLGQLFTSGAFIPVDDYGELFTDMSHLYTINLRPDTPDLCMFLADFSLLVEA